MSTTVFWDFISKNLYKPSLKITNSIVRWFNNDKWVFVCVALFAGVYAYLTYFWLQNDTLPHLWDPSQYLDKSVELFRGFTSNLLQFLRIYKNAFGGGKAPLISVLPIPFYLLFGLQDVVIDYWMTFLTIIFVLVSFWFYRQYLENWSALFAGLLLSLMPVNVAMSRNYYVEYTLVIWVLLWMIALHKSSLFQSRVKNLIIGILLGIGLLLKTSFLLYAIPPAGVYFVNRIRLTFNEGKQYRGYRLRSIPYKKVIVDLGLIIIPAILIASTWYAFNLKNVIDFGYSSSFGDMSQSYSLGNPLELDTLFKYGLQLLNTAVSPYIFFTILFLGIAAGIRWTVRKNKDEDKTHVKNAVNSDFHSKNSEAIATIFLLVLPLLVTTLATNKLIRFVEPVLPALVLFGGMAFESIFRSQKQKIIVGVLLLLFPFSNFVYWSISIPRNYELKSGNILWMSDAVYYARVASNDDWHIIGILRLIEEDIKTKSEPVESQPCVVITANDPYFNHNIFNYFAKIENYSFWVEPSFGTNESEWLNDAKAKIENAPYLITKSGGNAWLFNNDRLFIALDEGKFSFVKIGSFELPDGTKTNIFRSTAFEND